MVINKSHKNDGLTKAFYETFWNETKEPLLKSVQHTNTNQQLRISLRKNIQITLKLLVKKDKR